MLGPSAEALFFLVMLSLFQNTLLCQVQLQSHFFSWLCQVRFRRLCYVRSNPRGSLKHLLCQVQSQRLLETLVMLGPFQDTLLCQVQSLGTCYVRSYSRGSWRHLLRQVCFKRLCYVSSISCVICYPRSSYGDVCQLRTTF